MIAPFDDSGGAKCGAPHLFEATDMRARPLPCRDKGKHLMPLSNESRFNRSGHRRSAAWVRKGSESGFVVADRFALDSIMTSLESLRLTDN